MIFIRGPKPPAKPHNFLIRPQGKKGKPPITSKLPKSELHNSTFFQQRFCHVFVFCLIASVSVLLQCWSVGQCWLVTLSLQRRFLAFLVQQRRYQLVMRAVGSLASSFCIAAPAELHVTELPYLRPFLSNKRFKRVHNRSKSLLNVLIS